MIYKINTFQYEANKFLFGIGKGHQQYYTSFVPHYYHTIFYFVFFIFNCYSIKKILLQVYVKMVYGNFIGRDKFNTTGTLDGGHFSGVPWVSALINGRGRHIDRKTG